MALYTSFYARQLALRPESVATGEPTIEGEKNAQKSVARRTIDFSGPYLSWLEKKKLIHNPSDTPGLLGIPSSALDILPPIAYVHQPASSFAVKFAGQAPSKTRSSVNATTWTPDGRRCLTGTQAGEFCLWDGQTFQFETIIQAHETPVRTFTYTHAGNFLISGDDAGNVRYWRTNLELVKNFAAHREAVRQLAFAPGDLKFATGSDDSTVRVWDFARVASEQVLAGHGGDVKCIDWHPSKAIIVSGSKDSLIKLWCPRSGRNIATMHGHNGTITASQWSSNGNWVLTAARDQTCKVYDIRMQAELATFVGHSQDITQASWHSVHEELFVSGGQDGSLCFWLVGRQGPQAEVPAAHEGAVWSMDWHPQGHLLVTGASDAATKFWCRGRPGDPFMEQQEAEQAELAALVEDEVAAAGPMKAPAPSLFAPSSAAAGAAIPGIGEGMRTQVAAPALDIYAAAAAVSSYQPPAAAAPLPAYGNEEPADYRSGSRGGRERERRDDWGAPAYESRGGRRDRERSPPGGRSRRTRDRSPPSQQYRSSGSRYDTRDRSGGSRQQEYGSWAAAGSGGSSSQQQQGYYQQQQQGQYVGAAPPAYQQQQYSPPPGGGNYLQQQQGGGGQHYPPPPPQEGRGRGYRDNSRDRRYPRR